MKSTDIFGVTQMKRSAVAMLFAACFVPNGIATAQPADEYVSGLLHQPQGAITTFTVTERKLKACCLGSSGKDGVEVRFDSLHGGGVSVDFTPMLGATGVAREILLRPKGWDGTVKGNLRVNSDADGVLTEEYDFSAIGATSVAWRLLDEHDGLLEEGSVAGPVLAWGLDLPVAPGAVADKRFRLIASPSGFTARQGFFDLAVTVDGLSSVPVTGVHTIEVTPVPCAGCPNDPWEDINSVILTGSGFTELDVTDAHLETFGVESWGLGQAHLAEECIGVPPPCAGADRGLVADNLGSSGEDGVAIDFGPGSSGGEAARACVGCSPGHVTILQLYDDNEQELGWMSESSIPGTGQGTLAVDFSALGCTEFDVAYISTDGTSLALERCANGTVLDVPNPDTACSVGGNDNWRFEKSGVIAKKFCAPSGALALPSGAGVSGVSEIRLLPADPTVPHQHVRRVALTSPDPDPITIVYATAFRPLYVSGLPHEPFGGVSNLSVEGRKLKACCLGSTGKDGVEVRFDSVRGGGVNIDLTPLLGATGVARDIRVRPKGWDGTVKGNLVISSDAAGNLSEEYDFSIIGATALDWRLLNAHGGVLDQGTVSGPVITWGLEAASGGTVNKRFSMDSNASGMRSAGQGFFDIAMTVSGLTGVPVAGVHAIDVTPVQPCAGCPDGPPWNDLRSIELSADGVPEIELSDAHLTTFGVQSWAVGQAHVSEQCDNPLIGCDSSLRQLEVRNIGSSGEDGVAIDLGSGASGGQVVRKYGCPGCPPGHTTLLIFSDEGGETFRATHAENPLAGHVELQVDSAGLGAAQSLVSFYDDGGIELGSVVVDSTSVVAYTPAVSDAPDIWSWVGGRYVLRAGVPLHVDTTAGSFADVERIEVIPLIPSLLRSSSRVAITTDNPSGFVIESVIATPAEIGDVDRDGDIDLADFSVLAQCLSGPNVATHPPTCDELQFQLSDLDRDVDVDLSDYSAFQRAPLSN
jgi:hypothetical protein